MIEPLPQMIERGDKPKLSLVGATLTQPPVRPRQAPVVLHTRVVRGSGGGPDKTIFRSARYIDHTRLSLHAAYICPYGDPGTATLRSNAQRWGCPFWEVPESGPVDPRTAHRLLNLCKQLNVAIWHGHDYKSNALGIMLARHWPMKLVTTIHGWTWETVRTKLYYHVDNWCLQRYDHIIAVSPKHVEHCKRLGVQDERITYIPNAIEPNEYRFVDDHAAARRELGVWTDRLIIGTIGRFSIEKGVDRAIKTFAQLRTQYPNAELHLIGDGPQRAYLEALADQLEISQAVRFWGWQTQAQRFYEMMDVLLLPSHTEGLPNVVLEAMAMGVPVAATDVGGVSDLLDHGRCGVILSQDESTWPDRLSYLLDSARRRSQIARVARARIENRYTFTQRMAKVFSVYQQVMNDPLLPVAQPAPERMAA